MRSTNWSVGVGPPNAFRPNLRHLVRSLLLRRSCDAVNNGRAATLGISKRSSTWLPALPLLQNFVGEIVLNVFEPAALVLADSRLRPATSPIRLEHGNVLRAS